MTADGKCIAITGATGGIGAATARRLASQGARVVLIDVDRAAVDEHASRLESEGHRVLGVAADTTDEPAMEAAASMAVSTFGRLDGLVTAAAIDHAQIPALDTDLALWERVQRVNVTGTFVACRVAARRMLEAGGSIVTVGSVSAVTARMGKVPYCSSKAAVLGLTRALALELAAHGIRVNSVCPGPTDTPMVRRAVDEGGPEVLERRVRGSLEQFRPGIPLGRMGTPDEQAALIEFVLLSATFMTGAAVFSDGGLTVL